MSKEQLIQLCLEQLTRLFGDASQDVMDIKMMDWSAERYTATDTDLNTAQQHPQYPDTASRSFYNNSIFLAGTEFAREHGGYLEGAIESADEVFSMMDIES